MIQTATVYMRKLFSLSCLIFFSLSANLNASAQLPEDHSSHGEEVKCRTAIASIRALIPLELTTEETNSKKAATLHADQAEIASMDTPVLINNILTILFKIDQLRSQDVLYKLSETDSLHNCSHVYKSENDLSYYQTLYGSPLMGHVFIKEQRVEMPSILDAEVFHHDGRKHLIEDYLLEKAPNATLKIKLAFLAPRYNGYIEEAKSLADAAEEKLNEIVAAIIAKNERAAAASSSSSSSSSSSTTDPEGKDEPDEEDKDKE